MSVAVAERVEQALGDAVVACSTFRGDEVVEVKASQWRQVAEFLRHDDAGPMDHFVDLTAVDYPLRVPERPRFDVLLLVRATRTNARLRVRTELAEGAELASLCAVWPGANWAEREVFDMFGIRFADHPDLRRILMYEEFEGHPLRKDYPIDRVQPLVAYRDAEDIDKLPPFGLEEGQPFGRLDWSERLVGRDLQVSPSIALHSGERAALSASDAARRSVAPVGWVHDPPPASLSGAPPTNARAKEAASAASAGAPPAGATKAAPLAGDATVVAHAERPSRPSSAQASTSGSRRSSRPAPPAPSEVARKSGRPPEKVAGPADSSVAKRQSEVPAKPKP